MRRRCSVQSLCIVTLAIVSIMWSLRTQSSLQTLEHYSLFHQHQFDIDVNEGGVYRFPRQNHLYPTTTNPKKPILVYITTHWSNQHRSFIQYCWPHALAHLQLFQHADVAVFSTASEARQLRDMHNSLPAIFQSTSNLTIYQYHMAHQDSKVQYANVQEQMKQQGAILALTEAGAKGYFDGYEWVIRVNPDVLIQDDEWLLQTMLLQQHNGNDDVQNKTRPSLLYVSCNRGPKIHTDFFAIRPAALPPGALAHSSHGNAERSFAALTKGLEKWEVPDAKPFRGCRVTGPLVEHFHFSRFGKGNHTCPAVFRHTRQKS